MQNFDLDVLRTVLAIAEEGSFSRAATRIGRTQSAVSMQMRRLEEALGKRLFERDARHVSITPAGEALIGYARRILGLQHEAWTALARPELRGRVQLGMPDDYAFALLPPLLRRFAASHPGVEVELTCDPSTRLEAALAAGELDLAVITRGPGGPGQLLRREKLLWFGAPQHDTHGEDPLPLALYQPGCVAREIILKTMAASGRRYRIAYSSPSLVGLAAVVQAGLAIAVVVACSLPAGVRVLGEREGLPRLPALDVALARGTRALSAPAERLGEEIQHSLGEPTAMAASA